MEPADEEPEDAVPGEYQSETSDSVTTWGLLLGGTSGLPPKYPGAARIIGHLTGTREQAMKALRRRAIRYAPPGSWAGKRRLVYEQEDGYLLVLERRMHVQEHYRFSLGELIHDSDWPQ